MLSPNAQRLLAFGPTAIALILGAAVLVGLGRANAGRQQVARTHQAIAALEHVILRMVEAETAARGYLRGDSTSFQPYLTADSDLRAELTRLRAMTSNNPRQQRRLDTLQTIISTRLESLDSAIIPRRTVTPAQTLGAPVTRRDKAMTDSARALIATMEGEEQRLLLEQLATEVSRSRLVVVLVAVGSVFAAFLALLTNGLLQRTAATQAALAVELADKNARLREQAADLSDANEAKLRFLTAMSHEMRTPLNAIDGYAQLLQMEVRGPVNADQLTDLSRIRRNGEYVMGMINDILHFAKIGAGQIDLHISAFRLHEALAEVEALIAPQVNAKRLTYRYEPCDPNLIVQADTERVQQVITNLVTNAIKFTEPEGVIALSSQADADFVRVCVADTGRGIPAERLASIFEPFVQLERASAAAPLQGIGLGLAIARDLVVRMGGELSVESVVGHGSTFTVRLQRADVSAIGALTKGVVAPKGPSISVTLRPEPKAQDDSAK